MKKSQGFCHLINSFARFKIKPFLKINSSGGEPVLSLAEHKVKLNEEQINEGTTLTNVLKKK